MTNKFDFYDILGFLIPGTLLVCWVPICFPSISSMASALKFPSAFAVIALTALSVMLGHLMQAVGSIIEPAIQRTWGGKRSQRALTQGIKGYLSQDAAKRIREKLCQVVGPEASDTDLFYYALQRTDAANIGRTTRFNSLYAYHRGLIVFFLIATALLAISTIWGPAASWTTHLQMGAFAGILVLLILVWYRTNQRDAYYVKEVLFTVERVLDEASAKPANLDRSTCT